MNVRMNVLINISSPKDLFRGIAEVKLDTVRSANDTLLHVRNNLLTKSRIKLPLENMIHYFFFYETLK